MLIRDNAVLPIDSLRVPIDEVSPGLSHDYAAPEQIEGLRPTPACDVWAFGVVLYEAATGRRPFRAASTQARAGGASPKNEA